MECPGDVARRPAFHLFRVVFMIAQLLPADGAEPITIEHDVTIVGRNPKLCDLVLDHVSISKIHCVITRTDGLLFFRDLASMNGTRVNGQRAVRGALLPNDELQFGRARFTVFLGPNNPVPFEAQTEAIRLEDVNLDDLATDAGSSGEIGIGPIPSPAMSSTDRPLIDEPTGVPVLEDDSDDELILP